MKLFIKFLLPVLFIIVLLSIAFLVSGTYLNQPVSGIQDKDILFTISEGDSLNSISNSLAKLKLIKYSWVMKIYSRIMGTQSKFKVGTYRISTDMTLIQIHDYLIEGKQQLYKVTIPEGWTSRQIADYLDSQGITNAEDFLKTVKSGKQLLDYGLETSGLEGFIYPDTYFFQKNFPADKVLKVMVDTFFIRLENIYPAYRDLDKKELYNKVILASIVEREYRDPDEAALMAGVFYNRLSTSNPIPLGSCATIAYIITDIEKKPHPGTITYSDLKIVSPYNTYINLGLPPGPISNPGEVALKAVFFPIKSDYFYFLLKNPESGQHEFTRTLSEHTSAYNLYIKKN